MKGKLERSPDILPEWPTAKHQITYGLTGALAGACTLPIDILWQRLSASKPPSSLQFLRASAPSIVYRAGCRFWTFDIAKSQLQYQPLPTWIKGGLSGAAGGFAEICTQSLAQRRLPTVASLANQPSKLFLCFGTYTYLSTTLSPNQLPPKPFWYCWIMGAAAGGLGSGIISRAEGLKGKALWGIAVPKGALIIGTVIAVQVTSCASILERIND